MKRSKWIFGESEPPELWKRRALIHLMRGQPDLARSCMEAAKTSAALAQMKAAKAK